MQSSSSERLSWGLTLLAVSLLLELIVSAYAFANLGMNVDIQAAQTQVNPLQIAIGCIAPLSIVLTLVGIAFVFADRKRVGGTHARLTGAALALLIIGLLAQGGVIALSFSATMQGNLSSLLLAGWIGALAGIMGYAALLLLVTKIAPNWARVLTIASLAAYAVATLGTTILSAQTTTLTPYDMMGQTMYIPQVGIDRTAGIYPILAGLGVLGTLLMLAAYAGMAVTAWRTTARQLPGAVA